MKPSPLAAGLVAVALGGILVALLAPLSVWLALRSPVVRAVLLDWVAGEVAASTGVELTADASRLSLLEGRLELEGLALAASASPEEPFLTADRMVVEVDWSDLLSAPRRVNSLVLTRLSLDLGAALPRPETAPDDRAGDDQPDFEILDLRVHDGAVARARIPVEAEVWADSWLADDLEMRASMSGADLRIDDLTARVVVESSRRPEVEARFSGVAALAGERLTVQRLRLEGESLLLEATGTLPLDGGGEAQAEFLLDAGLGRLFPDLVVSGHARSKGTLSIRVSDETRVATRATIEITDFPATLLEPWIESLRHQDLEVMGTSLDVTGTVAADLSLGPEHRPEDRLEGDLQVVWHRGREELLSARVRTLESAAAGAVRLAVDGALLPANPGSRSLHGVLVADHWRELPLGGRLEAATLALKEPDLQALWAKLGLSPESFAGWWPAGSLAATASAEGPVTRPDLGVSATWQLEGDEILRVDLEGRPESVEEGREGLAVTLSADLLPGFQGTRSVEADMLLPDWTDPARTIVRSSRFEVALADATALADWILERLPAAFTDGPHAKTLDQIQRLREGGVLTGSLEGQVSATGSVLSLGVDSTGVWSPAADENLSWHLAGTTSTETPYLRPTEPVDLQVGNFDLARLESLLPELEEGDETWRPLAGRLTARASATSFDGGGEGFLEAEVQGLALGTEVRSGIAHLNASLEEGRLSLNELTASFVPSFREADGPVKLVASGWSVLEKPLRRARFQGEILRPDAGPDVIELLASVGDGGLDLEISSGGLGGLRGTASLGVVSGLIGSFGGYLPLPSEGRFELTLDAANVERWQAILEASEGLEEGGLRLSGIASGALSADPTRLTEAVGRLHIEKLGMRVDDQHLVIGKELTIRAGGRRLEVPETSWVLRGSDGSLAPLSFGGRVHLSSSWRAGEPLAGVFERVDADLKGKFDASILTPFLQGGVASGDLEVEASMHGPPTAMVGEIRLNGPTARALFPATYPTLIEAPVLAVELRDGRWNLESGRLKLNGGQVDLTLEDLNDGGRRIGAEVKGARYRLDHGLIADLNGSLSLTLPALGRSLLSGTLTLERGVLRRDVSLEREILRLSGERSLDGSEDDVFNRVDFDLDIVTLDGIWIKNNLADLRADWSLLRVRGTLSDPRVSGRIDIESGGIVTAFGQTVRIDEASLVLSGDPDIPPRLELETTSSLEDPRLRQNQANFWATGQGEQGPGMGGLWDTWYRRDDQASGADDVSTGLTNYYSNLFAESLAGGFDRVQLSFEPLPVLGETDTQARLTVAYHVSPEVSLFTSQNPRRAEGRTEVLDLSGFSIRPSLRAQLFNDDDNRSGVTLQEVVQFGGRDPLRDASPRLRSVRIDLPTRRMRRRVKRSIDYRKGDPFPDGSELNVEVDALEALRQRGYPGATVEVVTTPTTNRRIDLEVGVVPGTAVRYEFEGEDLPRRVRRSVRALYQPVSVDRGASLEDMEAEVARTLRARGYLHPEVLVTVEESDIEELSVVRIASRGGREVDPGPPRFPDLDAAAEAGLAGRFNGRLARVELAATVPGALAFLRQSLRGMGFAEPSVGDVELSADGRELTVGLDPGRRMRIGRVTVAGMSDEDALPILTRLGIEEGEPLRTGRLTQAALSLEDLLRERGHLQAGVEAEVEGLEDWASVDPSIRVVVEPGPVSRVGSVEMKGLKASRPSWASRKLGLTEGDVLVEHDLQAARRRLSRTGVFHRISLEVGDEEASGEERTVTLVVEERPRYLLGLGARWQEDSGLGVVVDAVDRHFLGLGQTFGSRISYSDVDKRLRLFHAMALGRDKTLETFIEARDEKDPALDDLETRAFELWVQLSFPLNDATSTRVYAVAQRRRFKLTGLDEGLIDPEDNTPFAGWQLLFDTRGAQRGDRPPRKWNFFYGHDLIGFAEALGGSATGLGLFGNVKLDLPLMNLTPGSEAPRNLTWVQSYRLGWIEAFEGELPFVDRLRAGGEFSVRGYPTDSLGPLSPEGVPLGGDFMVVINQELQALLIPRLAGVLFFDAGNVWLNRDNFDSTLFKSVGVGLRYASPVGPLRLDWAFPLDRREGDPSSKVYVGFGPTF